MAEVFYINGEQNFAHRSERMATIAALDAAKAAQPTIQGGTTEVDLLPEWYGLSLAYTSEDGPAMQDFYGEAASICAANNADEGWMNQGELS